MDSSDRTARSGSHPFAWPLFWCVLVALAVRFVVIAFVYQSYLTPERDHWLFGFELGKIARSLVLGHGFGNPYYDGNTGPTAEVGPVLPYIMAGVFAVFGIYTKASAIVTLGINSLFSALTCFPVFFCGQKEFRRVRCPLGHVGLGVFPICDLFFRGFNVGPRDDRPPDDLYLLGESGIAGFVELHRLGWLRIAVRFHGLGQRRRAECPSISGGMVLLSAS